MKKIHEKSHNCQENSWKIGGRRRKCSVCKVTWSVWKKQRGRRSYRPNKKLLEKIFVERQRLSATAAVRLGRLSLRAASHRLSQTIIQTTDVRGVVRPETWKRIDYILLIDALWYRFGKERHTVYLMAVKPVGEAVAKFLPPVMLPGKESLTGWQATIDTLPQALKDRIKALVSDGWRGVERLALENGWILQRCHFHFISQMQVNRGRWKKLPDQAIREDIYQLARRLLTTRNKVRIYKEQLVKLLRDVNCPNRMKAIITDFLTNIHYFRAYINYPQMNLPNTTNSMESMNKQIRDTCRYQRTPESLKRWVRIFLKLNPDITCNGANHTQN